MPLNPNIPMMVRTPRVGAEGIAESFQIGRNNRRQRIIDKQNQSEVTANRKIADAQEQRAKQTHSVNVIGSTLPKFYQVMDNLSKGLSKDGVQPTEPRNDVQIQNSMNTAWRSYGGMMNRGGANIPEQALNAPYDSNIKMRLDQFGNQYNALNQAEADKSSSKIKTYIDPKTNKPFLGSMNESTGVITPSSLKGGSGPLEAGFAPSTGKAGDWVIDKRTGKKLWEIPKTRSEKIKDDINSRGWAQLNLDKKSAELKESPGWQKVDTDFATDYNEMVTQGGLADAIKGVGQMGDVVESLNSGRNMTGPLLSLLPDAVRKRALAESMNTQELLEEVVQRNLRVILGAQFTENEGKRLIARAYNPALSEKINARRVGRLMNQMQSALNAKLEAVEYFEENGTLRGYSSKALRKEVARLRSVQYGPTVRKRSTKTNAVKSGKKKVMSDDDILNEVFK